MHCDPSRLLERVYDGLICHAKSLPILPNSHAAAHVFEKSKITSLQCTLKILLLGPRQFWPTLHVFWLATHGYPLAGPCENVHKVWLHMVPCREHMKILSFQLRNYIMKCICAAILLPLQHRGIFPGCFRFAPFHNPHPLPIRPLPTEIIKGPPVPPFLFRFAP